MNSGVSMFTGEPFVEVTVMLDGHTHAIGQLSPDETRQHGLAYLAAAEAAEQDALVFKVLTEGVGLDKEHAGAFVLRMREERGSE